MLRFGKILYAFLAAVVLTSLMASGLYAKTFDERICENLKPGEKVGIIKCGNIFGNIRGTAIFSIEKFESKNEPPVSSLMICAGEKTYQVEPYSVYIESIELCDLDGDGRDELIYARRGGVHNILEVKALKQAGFEKNGKPCFTEIFKSEGLDNGKFDIVKSEDKKTLPMVVAGGFVNAPGSSEPHLEYSRMYKFTGGKNISLQKVKSVTSTPTSISEEYEYAYLLISENNKIEGLKRMKRLVESLKNTKSQGNLAILKECNAIISAHEKVRK
ncbi:MAG TPA: hypothetical protein PKK26_01415 [Candidatus Wallbacteria bacterium]|nr:hypothetical protein [Candidatus Wallbacteria bacterium]